MSREREQQEAMNGSIPPGHFDGFDELPEPSPEYQRRLLEGAPPEVRERMERFAKERQQAGDGDRA